MENSHIGEKQPFLQRESKINLDEKDYKIKINQRSETEETNEISTSKYTIINCIPKIFFNQFSKMANLYFVMIAIMQSIDEISISAGKPVILLPLLVVVTINGIKDFMEDWKRKKSDDEENSRKCLIYNEETTTFTEKKWSDIKLGNIIKIQENEYFPADCVLLLSSEENGICYIESKNLDGETNLKVKEINSKISKIIKTENDFKYFKGELECKQPNEFIYEFDAKLNLTDKKESFTKKFSDDFNSNHIINNNNFNEKLINDSIFIEKTSFLLRGCSLRQTNFIYAFVVYIGHNTKIMKNSPTARVKISKIEKIMNFQIIVIFIFQTCLSFLGAIIYLILLNINGYDKLYYIFPDPKAAMKTNLILFIFFRTGTWTLIFTNLVPISLLVTLEMVKYIQGMFISWDINMYDKETRTASKVQTSTLNEELGQVKFIFSDKTGTLTKNYMEFKKMSIGNFEYGLDRLKDLKLEDNYGQITNFNLNDEEFANHLNNPKHDNYNNIHLFMLCLTLCHTVIVDQKDKEKLFYQSSSPDEMALVNCARFFNYIFKGRDINNNVYLEIKQQQETYQLLNVLEYTSERKRMSVIIKCPDNKIRLFMKGADIVIKERVSINTNQISISDQHLLNFAQKGLRTLMIAYKEISNKEYEIWSDLYMNALNKPLEKDKLLPYLYDKIEQDLYLLGSTAIEDKLQNNVSEVLDSFLRTGIKVWVLTGDKIDTAKAIAFSCKLITHEFVLLEFMEKSSSSVIKEALINYIEKIKFENEKNKRYALIVSMDELTRIMNKSELTELFYKLSILCNSVLCCRVTPKQKAQMVNLIKERQPDTTTLAIGDGANDVNMITSAHIGVGILGVEGRQAARASDYSIGQFQYLKRLLYIHGRESYRKNSFVVLYNFYKNVLFVLPQFWYGFVSYFSGQTLYDPWIYQLYNILFTSLPIIWFGIYDKEVEFKVLMKDTRYYTQGMIGKLFHSNRFWKWIVYGIIQAIIIYYLVYNSNNRMINSGGKYHDVFSEGSIAYSCVVLIVNIKLLFSTFSHTFVSTCLILGSIFSYYIVLAIGSLLHKLEIFNNFPMIINSGNFYFSTLLVVAFCILIDIGVGRILLIFDIVLDPLKINPEQFEKTKENILREELITKEKNNDCS